MSSTTALHCTAGHEGSVGVISCMSIFSACFGLPTSVQLAATTCTCQIWISGWILPHFDVRTISVAWKLKKLSNIFWQKIFFLLNPLSKGVAPLCIAIPIYVSTYLHLFISSNTASSQCIQPVIFTFYISIMVSMRPLNTSSTAACQPHLGFFATLRLLVLFWNSYSYSHLQLWDQKIQTGLEARESSY